LKISREFAARLKDRRPDEMVRVIVMLETEQSAKKTGRRVLRAQRKTLTKAARRSVDMATVDIAGILKKYGGRRLEREIGSLGGLAVETTPAGIRTLADCPKVKAILEDQSLSLIFR